MKLRETILRIKLNLAVARAKERKLQTGQKQYVFRVGRKFVVLSTEEVKTLWRSKLMKVGTTLGHIKERAAFRTT